MPKKKADEAKLTDAERATGRRELEKAIKEVVAGAYKRGTAEGTRSLGRIIMAVIDDDHDTCEEKLKKIKSFASAAMRVRVDIAEG